MLQLPSALGASMGAPGMIPAGMIDPSMGAMGAAGGGGADGGVAAGMVPHA